MQSVTEHYLSKVNRANLAQERLRRVCTALSLFVILTVFWGLKLTGITMAGEAFCGTDEHVHDADCGIQTLICGEEECPEHRHSDDCLGKELVCPWDEVEGHTHSGDCFETTLACGLPEDEDHSHGEDCMQSELTCPLEETDGHIHTEDCYFLGTDYVCGLEETLGHTHTEDCYQMDACPLKEHIHTESCYSNLSADLETSDDWEDSLAGLVRSPSTAENILMVARSQLGVAESTVNFQVDELGIRRGISRYGQWYGNPYGDWSAMFVGFCLEYAGVMDVPVTAGPETMRLEWEEAGLYTADPDYIPVPGELLFLDKDENGEADAVAVITDLEEYVLFVIEGDTDEQVTEIDTVRLYPEADADLEEPKETDEGLLPEEALSHSVLETLYSMGDTRVMGYGTVPFAPGLMLLPEGGSARAPSRSVWLDGTNGGIMSLNGSANTRYYAEEGTVFTLPVEWQSPAKYSYTLRGWYDVTNNKYYEPGAQVRVTGNMVFYADWAASTYDVGQFNNQVTETISTKDFVTVRMFDYGVLFNVLSERANISFGNNNHTETWNLITSGNNPYNNQPTLNYILRDWDKGSEDISYPNGTNDRNNPTDAGQVYPGLYTDKIRDLLFDPETQVIGKEYLGEGDYLFQLCLDPSHEHYGYYYYNSERNAASYNQTDQRFYVYDYLECTRTSLSNGDEGKYSDFLPLNSPYANTNGKRVNTYTYAGVEGEYNGVTHYMYDCRYNDSDNSTNNVGTNFWFGMSVGVEFYLPNKPGEQVPGGGYGNQDIYGKDMHFRFTGDDDVWVFVDGKMMLDLGGIHGMESGDINFATGTVTINGAVNQTLTNNLRSLTAGEHTLTLYYLERGSSMSNCAIYFNLAPRFSFSIQKEDVLTRNVLDGAEFSVYLDEKCTVPAELWTSKAAHDRKEPSTNVFTVVNGAADMWGMGAGNVYYIKETKPPSDPNFTGIPNGVIRLVFDKLGTASYSVEIIDTGQGVSGGFTVHGLRVDTETQQAYIVATNAPVWVKDTTGVQVRKQWDDNVSHSTDTITVYLTVTDQTGTVTRIQEANLSAANNWRHEWENLPKFWQDGTPIHYGVEEAYIPGYYGTVEQVNQYQSTHVVWSTQNGFTNNKTYLLAGPSGYLTTLDGNADTGFTWVDRDTAASSPRAQWKANVVNNQVRLTNGIGQTLTFYYNGGSSGYPTDFFASTAGENNESKQYFRYSTANGGIRLYYDGADGRDYYMSSGMTSSSKFNYSTSSGSGLVLTPTTQTVTTVTENVTGWGYLVTNTPLEKETSLTVQKHWDYGYLGRLDLHEQLRVTVRLLANGKDTGRTLTLSFKNGWNDTFRGLPYEDEAGDVIHYTVEEVWEDPDWAVYYGEVQTVGGSPPTYKTDVTNRYKKGMGGPMLPSTGTSARMMYTMCGSMIMLTALVLGMISRRKRERRMK